MTTSIAAALGIGSGLDINALVMKDPRLACNPQDMPFDGMRMFWGGFKPLVEA